jgi:hypothetical protein
MNGENPYAPPAVAETEASSTRYWYTYGTSLIVRNGATLPKIDLETGAGDEEQVLRPIRRIHEGMGPGGIVSILIYVAMTVVLINVFKVRATTIFFVCLVASLGYRQASALRGGKSQRVSIWTFIEERRAKRAALRRYLRIGLMLSVFGLTVGTLFIPISLPSIQIGGFMKVWIYQIVPACALLIVGMGIWAFLDRPKYKLHSADPGWLRITPIHPQALAFLHAIEAEEEQLRANAPLPRKRLVRTVFYHRYPLRLLIGHRIHNPLFILQCAVMKLLRSRLLVRDSYHFSEAEEVPLEKLCPSLREAAQSWLDSHPGWSFITGERLPSPAGDLVIENTVLASPCLEHCASISRAWLEQRESKGVIHFTFRTWFADGTHASTYDQPFLVLDPTNAAYRASGPPEHIWQAHLRHLSTHPISPASDPAELRARLLHEKEETDRLLTEKGFQSEVRESY